MIKRTAASVLWFFTVATAWNVLGLMWDVPSILGIAVGLIVAAFVWADPFHVMWTRASASPAHADHATLAASAGLPNQV